MRPGWLYLGLISLGAATASVASTAIDVATLRGDEMRVSGRPGAVDGIYLIKVEAL